MAIRRVAIRKFARPWRSIDRPNSKIDRTAKLFGPATACQGKVASIPRHQNRIFHTKRPCPSPARPLNSSILRRAPGPNALPDSVRWRHVVSLEEQRTNPKERQNKSFSWSFNQVLSPSPAKSKSSGTSSTRPMKSWAGWPATSPSF